MKNIGVIGIRGYDVVYCGYETFIKQLMVKSDTNDFFYYLYCRSKYQKNTNETKKNYSLIVTPTISGKYLETFFYALFSTFDSIFKKIDIILYLGTANTYLIFIQKLLKRKTIVNTAGIDWQKKRWSLIGKWYLKLCEKMTVCFADIIVCDSIAILNYYKEKYQAKNYIYISYGPTVNFRKPGEILKRYNLRQNQYIYTVARLSPENCVEDLIIAFKQIATNVKCIIVGDSSYEDQYKEYLARLAENDQRIKFVGILNGNDYDEICSNSYAYIETKNIGGTHQSLLDAIFLGKYIIAKNIPENAEVLGASGLLYDKQKGEIDLLEKLLYIFTPSTKANKTSKVNRNQMKTKYNWTKVIAKYESIFRNHLQPSFHQQNMK